MYVYMHIDICMCVCVQVCVCVCVCVQVCVCVFSAFYPLVGDVIHGVLGDFIDAVSMACTTCGVCTSLGFGADVIFAGIRWDLHSAQGTGAWTPCPTSASPCVCTYTYTDTYMYIYIYRRLDCGMKSWDCDTKVPSDDGSLASKQWKVCAPIVAPPRTEGACCLLAPASVPTAPC